MTHQSNWVSTGLVFLSTRDIDITEAAQKIGETVEALGHRVRSTKVLTPASARLETSKHRFRISLHRDHALVPTEKPASLYLNLEVEERTDLEEPSDLAGDAAMICVLRGLFKAYDPDLVKWIGPNEVIPRQEFAEITASLDPSGKMPKVGFARPKRPVTCQARPNRPERRAALLPSISESRDRLDQRLMQEARWAIAPDDQNSLRKSILSALYGDEIAKTADGQPDPVAATQSSAPLRLSAWMLSIAVSILCLPVGVALMIVNLLRGENLRLSSQAAALTGTFVTLQATGSMAQAAEVVQALF